MYTHPGASDTPLPPADVATAHKREDDAVSNGQPIALETVAYEGEVIETQLCYAPWSRMGKRKMPPLLNKPCTCVHG